MEEKCEEMETDNYFHQDWSYLVNEIISINTLNPSFHELA